MASIYSLCKATAESAHYLFMTCPFVTPIWNWLRSVFPISLNLSSIRDILKACDLLWSPQVKEVIVASIIHSIHVIWQCRNQSRFKANTITEAQAISKIKLATTLSGNQSTRCAFKSLKEFQILKILNISINYSKDPSIIEVIWFPPFYYWTKINSDGAAKGAPRHSGGGGTIYRDHNGDMLWCFSIYFGIHDALYAELNLAIMALEYANDRGWTNIWLECDSITVVNIFNGKIKPRWKLLGKWQRCMLLRETMNCKVTHIFREGNQCADSLANHAISAQTFNGWNVPPPFIIEALNMNMIFLPSYRFANM
ncbi:PREDICTED: uncharacterized protein LOC109335437 [Lupinus angustifolius]|uniref:uncharacterized protein LOC109335437 n=1 Tax=Lupinus angustifolius TaxID=3871 RepID=UPI00092ED12C|nr:PREDICTED: uncharacterized protein LOC109335437 [Lupinus angustifolius]